jgi:hypothetical protein
MTPKYDEKYRIARAYTISLSQEVIDTLQREALRLGFTRTFRGEQVPCVSYWLRAVADQIRREEIERGEV